MIARRFQEEVELKKPQDTPHGLQPKDWIVFIAGFVIVASLLGFVVVRNRRQPQTVPPGVAQVPLPVPAETVSTDSGDHDHDHTELAAIPRITAIELRAAMESGQAIAVDVRDMNGYTASHIAGSYHIPLAAIESQIPYLPRGKTIVAYCT